MTIDFVTERSKICEIRRVFSCGIFKGVGDGCARRFNIRIGGYRTLVLRWNIYTKTNRKCEMRGNYVEFVQCLKGYVESLSDRIQRIAALYKIKPADDRNDKRLTDNERRRWIDFISIANFINGTAVCLGNLIKCVSALDDMYLQTYSLLHRFFYHQCMKE